MARRTQDSKPTTNLGRVRVKRGVTQGDLAYVTGISLRTYKRIEAGQITNPPVRYLINLATALGVPIEELFEDDWTPWSVLDGRADEPPRHLELWGSTGVHPDQRAYHAPSLKRAREKATERRRGKNRQRAPRDHVLLPAERAEEDAREAERKRKRREELEQRRADS